MPKIVGTQRLSARMAGLSVWVVQIDLRMISKLTRYVFPVYLVLLNCSSLSCVALVCVICVLHQLLIVGLYSTSLTTTSDFWFDAGKEWYTTHCV